MSSSKGSGGGGGGGGGKRSGGQSGRGGGDDKDGENGRQPVTGAPLKKRHLGALGASTRKRRLVLDADHHPSYMRKRDLRVAKDVALYDRDQRGVCERGESDRVLAMQLQRDAAVARAQAGGLDAQASAAAASALDWVASGRFAYVQGDIGDHETSFVHVMYVPMCMLVENATSLVDFRMDNEQAREFARQAVFYLKAMANSSIGAREHSMDERRDNALQPGFVRTASGEPVPRVQVFVEAVLNSDDSSALLPRDPEDDDELRAAKPVSQEVMSRALERSKVAGFRFFHVVRDRRFTAAEAVKALIFQNQYDRLVVDSPQVLEYKQQRLVRPAAIIGEMEEADKQARLDYEEARRRQDEALRKEREAREKERARREREANDPELRRRRERRDEVARLVRAARDEEAAAVREHSEAAKRLELAAHSDGAVDAADALNAFHDADERLGRARVALEQAMSQAAANELAEQQATAAAAAAGDDDGMDVDAQVAPSAAHEDDDEEDAPAVPRAAPARRGQIDLFGDDEIMEEDDGGPQEEPIEPAAAAAEEEEEDDDGGRGGGHESQAEEAEEDDDEEEEGGGGPKPKKAKKKGGDKAAAPKKLPKLPYCPTASEMYSPTRADLASQMREKEACALFREIQSLEDLSKYVAHTYLQTAASALAEQHPDGLYAPRKELLDERYDLHNYAKSDMHPFKVWNLYNSMRVALLTSGARVTANGIDLPEIGESGARVCTAQLSEKNYVEPVTNRLSWPFPHVVWELPQYLSDPELLDLFKLPLQPSASEAHVADLERRLRMHEAALASMAAKKLSLAPYELASVPSPQELAAQQGLVLETVHFAAPDLASARDPDHHRKVLDLVAEDPGGERTAMLFDRELAGARPLASSAAQPSGGGADPSPVSPPSSSGGGAAASSPDVVRLRTAGLASHSQARRLLEQSAADEASLARPDRGGHREEDDAARVIEGVRNTRTRVVARQLGLSEDEVAAVPAETARQTWTQHHRSVMARRGAPPAAPGHGEAASAAPRGGAYDGGAGADDERDRERWDARAEEVRARLGTIVMKNCFQRQSAGAEVLLSRFNKVLERMPFKTEPGCQKEGGKAWSFDEEEEYRFFEKAAFMAKFRPERVDSLLGLLSLDNDTLPDVHLGMLMWLRERGEGPMATPVPTCDASLTSFANQQAAEMMQLENVLGTYQNHLLELELTQVWRSSVLRNENVTHYLIHGGAGVEKSYAVKQAHRLSLQESLMPSDHTSRLAFATAANKSLDYMLQFEDEASEVYTTRHERLNPEGRKRRELQKKLMTDLQIAFQRNAEQKRADGTTQRATESVARSAIRAVLACTNTCDLPMDDPIMDRLRYVLVFPWARRDTSMIRRVLFQRGEHGASSGGDSLESDQLTLRKRDEHALMVWSVLCQNTLALPSPSIQLFKVMISAALPLFEHWMTQVPEKARAISRADMDALCTAMAKGLWRRFNSEVAYAWRFSPGGERIEEVRPFDFAVDTPRLLATPFYAEHDVCLWAMARFFVEQVPLTVYLLMSAFFHEAAGFTRAYYAPAYRKYSTGWPLGLSLPDVEARSRQRGLPREQWREPTDFIRESRHAERKFVAQALRTHPDGPRLAFGRPLEIIQPGAEDDGGGGADKSRAGPHRPAMSFDPNYLVVEDAAPALFGRLVKIASRYFAKPDGSIVQRMVELLTQTKINIPKFNELRDRREPLEFAGCVQDALTGAYSAPEVENVSVLQVVQVPSRTGGGARVRLKIAAHFLMLSPFDMLYLFLTELLGYPALLHRFDVKPRRDHVLKVTLPRSMVAVSSTGRPLILSGNQRLNDCTVRFENVSPERLYFRRYLQLQAYHPNVRETESEAGAARAEVSRIPWASQKTFQERYASVADAHYDAPGKTEAMVAKRVRDYPCLSDTRNNLISYPEDRRAAYKAISRADKARKSMGNRANSQLLTDAETLDLVEDLARPESVMLRWFAAHARDPAPRPLQEEGSADAMEVECASDDDEDDEEGGGEVEPEPDNAPARRLWRARGAPALLRARRRELVRVSSNEQEAPPQTLSERLQCYLLLSQLHRRSQTTRAEERGRAPTRTEKALLDRHREQFGDVDFVLVYTMWRKQTHELAERRVKFRNDYARYLRLVVHPADGEVDEDPAGFLTREEVRAGLDAMGDGPRRATATRRAAAAAAPLDRDGAVIARSFGGGAAAAAAAVGSSDDSNAGSAPARGSISRDVSLEGTRMGRGEGDEPLVGEEEALRSFRLIAETPVPARGGRGRGRGKRAREEAASRQLRAPSGASSELAYRINAPSPARGRGGRGASRKK